MVLDNVAILLEWVCSSWVLKFRENDELSSYQSRTALINSSFTGELKDFKYLFKIYFK